MEKWRCKIKCKSRLQFYFGFKIWNNGKQQQWKVKVKFNIQFHYNYGIAMLKGILKVVGGVFTVISEVIVQAWKWKLDFSFSNAHMKISITLHLN